MGAVSVAGIQRRRRLSLAGTWLVQPVFPQASDEFLKSDPAKGWPTAVTPGTGRWLVADQPGNWRGHPVDHGLSRHFQTFQHFR